MLCTIIAVFLGIFLVVSPPFFIASFTDKLQARTLSFESASEGLMEMEKTTYGSESNAYTSLDFAVIAACVIVALAVYLFVKRLH